MPNQPLQRVAQANAAQENQLSVDSRLRERIPIQSNALIEFCRRNGISRLAAFGSVLREDFGPASDVDLLVHFEPGVRMGLRFFTLERELSELCGRKVDLNTAGFLSEYFAAQALAEAQDLYVAA